MADDGLLLNFTIGDGPLKPSVTFKGGTWRDRRREQKRERAIRSNNHTAVSALKAGQDTHDQDSIQDRATKRRKVRVDFSPTPPALRRRTEYHAQHHPEPKQIIS